MNDEERYKLMGEVDDRIGRLIDKIDKISESFDDIVLQEYCQNYVHAIKYALEYANG